MVPMARVVKYVRPIDSVYTGKILDKNVNLSNCGVQMIKESCSSEINNKTFSASARDQDNKNSKYKSMKKMKSVDQFKCPICMNDHKNRFGLEKHLEVYRNQYVCKKCDAVYVVQRSLDKHIKTCNFPEITPLYNFKCNFCTRSYYDKSFLQRHLFHVHGDLISSGETRVKSTCPLEKQNKSDGTISNNLRSSNSIPLKCLNSASVTNQSSSNAAPLTIFNDSSNSASSNDVLTTPVKMLNDIHSTSWNTNDSYRPPRKKLRQSTLTDFISWHKDKPVGRCVTATNKEDVPVFTSSNVTYKLQAEVINQSTTNRSNKSPFVHIHVSPKTMLSLLDQQTQAQLNYRSVAYNLRPTKLIFSPARHSESSDSSISPRTFQRIRYTRRRKRRIRLYSSSSEVQFSDAQLKMQFKCKDCSIRLNRCDEVVKSTNSKLSEVSLVKGTAFEKSVASQKQLGDEDGDDQTKMFRCHVCRRSLPSKKTLREHVKQLHKMYMSTVCNARYTSMKKLVNHYLTQHIVFKRKKCCVCYEEFNTTVLLKRHMMLHCIRIIPSKSDALAVNAEMNCIAVKKPHKCKCCSKRFWLHSCLQQHEKMCSRMNVKMNEKSIVPIGNPVQSSPMESRKRVSLPVTLEPINSNNDSNVQNLQQSPSFPTQYYSLNEQEAQLQAISAEEVTTASLASSDLGLNSYTHNKRLIKRVTCVTGYQMNVINKMKMKFPCTICGKQFLTFQNLCLHESTFCKPVINFCSTCGTAFTTKRLLQLHMLATHAPGCTDRYELFCRFCNQGFNKKTNLQVHERHFHIRHIPKPYLNATIFKNLDNPTCRTCNLMFQSYERFIEHNMYYYKNQIFACPVCGKSFRGMYKLHYHNKLVHYPQNITKSYVYVCNICNVGFNYESHLHAHKCHVHAEDPSSLLSNRNTLQDHTYAIVTNNMVMIEESGQTPIKTYNCNVCNLNFPNQRDLASHKREYFQGGDFLCDKCDRRCYTGSILAQHYSLNHTGSNISNLLKCRYCEEVLTTATSMQCHEKHFHKNNTSDRNTDSPDMTAKRQFNYDNVQSQNDDVDSNKCLTCRTTFNDKEDFRDHLLEYSDIGEHKCNICQRKFTESHLLEEHKPRHSLFDMSRHRCPICNEGFANSKSINSHVSHLHRFETFIGNSSRIFNVADFNEAAENMRSLPHSSSVNSVLKKDVLKCTVCKIEFSNRKNLMKHKSRFKNTGQHKCTICGRRFPWLNMLVQHTRKHTEKDDPLLKHKCPHCMEKFKSSVSLYSHIIHTHDKSILTMRLSGNKNGSKSNDVQGGDTNNEPTATVDQSVITINRTAATVDPSVTTIDKTAGTKVPSTTTIDKTAGTVDPLATAINAEETSRLNTISDTLSNAEKYSFAYTCNICNVKSLTLSELQTHVKTTHEKDPSERSSVQSDVVTHSVMSSTVIDVEEDRHCPMSQAIDQVSSSDHIEKENVDHSPNSDRSDAIEIVWFKESRSVECVTIEDEEDDVQIISDQVPLSNRQKIATLSKDRTVLDNIGKLRVRSFAKIMDDCEIMDV